MLTAYNKKQGKMEEFQEKITSVAQKIQSVKQIQEADKRRRAISDVYWAGMDLLEQIARSTDLDSKQKKEAGSKIMSELIDLLQKAGDAYVSKFKNGSITMAEENNEMISVRQANFLTEETLLRERKKFEEDYERQFKEKYGIDPDEAVKLAEARKKEADKIRKEAEQRAIDAFTEKLSDSGVNNAIVAMFKEIRKRIPSDGEKMEFVEGDKKEEVHPGVYLEKFFEKMIETAKAGKLFVMKGEQAKVGDDDNNFAEDEDLPELNGNEEFDEDSVKLDREARKFIAEERKAGRVVTYMEALAVAKKRLGKKRSHA